MQQTNLRKAGRVLVFEQRKLVTAQMSHWDGEKPASRLNREVLADVRVGSRSYGDGGKGLAPLSLCETRWRCPHDPS
jgi:hypothetical protein